MHRSVRKSFYGMCARAAQRIVGLDRFSEECRKRCRSKPGSCLLRVPEEDDLRWVLHEQGRNRGFAVYRQRDTERLAGMPSLAGVTEASSRRHGSNRLWKMRRKKEIRRRAKTESSVDCTNPNLCHLTPDEAPLASKRCGEAGHGRQDSATDSG